jgi:hypothetical protein
VGPLSLGSRVFDNYMIDLPIIASVLSLGIKISVGTPSSCEDVAGVGGGGCRVPVEALGFVAGVVPEG